MQLFIKSLKITRSILNQFSGRVPFLVKICKIQKHNFKQSKKNTYF